MSQIEEVVHDTCEESEVLPVLPLRLYALPAMNRFLLPRRNCLAISVH